MAKYTLKKVEKSKEITIGEIKQLKSLNPVYKGEEKVWEKKIIPKPTIYYTTTNGNQISDSNTRLSSYIVSHTKEDNGEYKIVLKDTMTMIPNNCFYYLSTLQTIRFENLDNVTSIGTYFLFSCSSLQSINLLGLSNVRSIGIQFLQDCTSLQSIDLTPLSKVTSIGNRFLQSCTSLVTLTMPNTTGITSIGNNYLYNCSKLTAIYCHKGTLDFYKGLMSNRASIMVEMD